MFHTIIIAGNLGSAPESRQTPSGANVCNFSVASNRQYTNTQGETVKETIWFRVSTWGKLAEVCGQYLAKGSKVLIEGRLIPDTATGGPRTYVRNDGGAGASFEVNASVVRFLSSKGEVTVQENGASPEGFASEEEIPF